MFEADLVITDVNLATMDSNVDAPYGAIEQGALIIKDDKIAWLGKQNKPTRKFTY